MSDAQPDPSPSGAQERPADAPTPPGGPQRVDAASAGLSDDDQGVGRTAADSVEDRHGGTIAEPQPPASSSGDPAQEENAETSLDQPSEG